MWDESWENVSQLFTRVVIVSSLVVRSFSSLSLSCSELVLLIQAILGQVVQVTRLLLPHECIVHLIAFLDALGLGHLGCFTGLKGH